MIGRRALLGLLAAAPAWAQGTRLPPVVLVDQSGVRRDLGAVAVQRPLVLSFFFTGCTTICPPQTAAMQALQGELAGWPEPRPLLLSVSLDPFGDTPEAMRAYAGRFGLELGPDKGWLLLGGDPRALLRVWRAFEQPEGRPEDHAAQIWLGAPGGRDWQRVGALTPPDRLAAMLRQMAP
ncbi:MAG: hypothetical protein DI601_16780 [Azospirillum brasilense]|nr:MAG: hypothetical protein DI601_16780 [Azospirillum brasilense]